MIKSNIISKANIAWDLIQTVLILARMGYWKIWMKYTRQTLCNSYHIDGLVQERTGVTLFFL